MKRPAAFAKPQTIRQLQAKLRELQRRLQAAEDIVRAIRMGHVDALVMMGPDGEEVHVLRGTDRHYRAVVEEMNEGALTLSDDGTLLYCNLRFAEMLKMPLDRVMGAPFVAFVAPEDRAKAERVLQAGLAGPTKEEIQLQAADGRSLVVELSMHEMRIEGARCLNVLALDITAHKRAEEQIRANAARAQALAHVASRLNAQLDFDAVLRIVCEEVTRALNVPVAMVWLYDATRHEYVLAAHAGLPPGLGAQVPGLPRATVEASFQPTGTRAVLVNAPAASGFFGSEWCARLGTCSIAMAALWHDGELFGVLAAIVTRRAHAFTDDETTLLQALANQAAQAGSNARLHEQVRRHADELEGRVAERTSELEAINRQLIDEIAEHARAEEALRESERRFRLLAENAQDLIYRIAFVPERRFEYVSPSALATTGYTPEEHYADPDLFLRLVHPDDREVVEAIVRGEISANMPLILRWIRKDGRLVWTEQRLVPLYDAGGNLLAVEGIARDITERKQAEEALRASEERFRLALADSPITVFNQDCELRYTWIYNPVAGITPEDMLGKTDADLWSPEQAAALEEIKRPALESGTVRRGEVALGSNGEIHVFDLTVEPRFDGAGDIAGITCVSVDVTDRKRSEEALQQANANLMNWAGELEQRNREISQLNEMGDLLQSCLTFEEAFRVIAQSARHLFPGDAGALFVLNNSKNLVEAAATWGELPGESFEHVFAPGSCWALRRGRIHVVDDSRTGLLCGHVDTGGPAVSYLCVPMMAQGETLGTLYVQSHPSAADASKGIPPKVTESKQRLAVSIAEHVALALSSLRLRETLQRQAIRDPLTGLFNRRYMEESLERELHRALRKQSSVGIVMLDLDFFKHFNDAFGHEVGDVILHAFGDFLQKHVRGGDIACRYGGEEFTLILPETSLEETMERAEQVRREIKSLQVQHDGQTFGNLSISLGVAVFPQQAETADGILRAADLALYRAKAQGRDRVVMAENQ